MRKAGVTLTLGNGTLPAHTDARTKHSVNRLALARVTRGGLAVRTRGHVGHYKLLIHQPGTPPAAQVAAPGCCHTTSHS